MVGSIYKHFKGHMYKVLMVVNDADSPKDEIKKVVIYQDINNEELIWARKYEDFISKVDKEKYPDVEQEYRFELIKNG